MLVHVLFKSKPRFKFFSNADTCLDAARDGKERSLFTDHALCPIGYMVFDDGPEHPEPICFDADLDCVPYEKLEAFDVQCQDE